MSTTATFRIFLVLCLATILQASLASGEDEGGNGNGNGKNSTKVVARYVVQLIPAGPKDARVDQRALQETELLIGKRLEAAGINHVAINNDGRDRVSIEVSGLTRSRETLEVVELLLHTVSLEFRILDEEETILALAEDYHPPKGKEVVILEPYMDAIAKAKAAGKELPKPRKLVIPASKLHAPDLDGKHIRKATAVRRPHGWVVDITFDEKGAKRMGEISGNNIGKQLAMIVNGKPASAPTIQAKFTDRCMIAGNYDEVSAKALAVALDHPLPHNLKLVASPDITKRKRLSRLQDTHE